MIEIGELKVVKPHEVPSGTLLIGGAHYDDPPMFLFSFQSETWRYNLDSGHKGFVALPLVRNLNPYVLAGEPTLLVDVEEKVSPTRDHMPKGAVVYDGEKAGIAVEMNYGTVYVALDGSVLDDPTSHERMVAFPRWRVVVPAFGHDRWHTVYEAGADSGEE